MKAYFLFLFLITCSYCLQIYQVSKGSRKSLSTYTTGLNYFYLTNSEYSSYSSYLYILLEDNGFSLSYSNVKYCRTDTNPNYYPDSAVNGCTFYYASCYKSDTSSSTKKYYYQISYSGSYYYTIISYSGSYSYGYLYATSDNNNLYQTILMTQVYRNSEKSLPTSTSYKKYFYLTNSDYYSSYIYIRLEDKNFGLDYSTVKYCQTNTNPYSYPDSAVSSCTFYHLDRYNIKYYSYSTKYYYKLSYSSFYSYTIISYSGSYSSGSLYVTANDVKFSDSDSSKVIIISVSIGAFIFLFVITIILHRCCTRCRRTKINSSIPVTQPTYATPAPNAYPMNQPAYNYAAPIPLQTAPTPMAYQAY